MGPVHLAFVVESSFPMPGQTALVKQEVKGAVLPMDLGRSMGPLVARKWSFPLSLVSCQSERPGTLHARVVPVQVRVSVELCCSVRSR